MSKVKKKVKKKMAVGRPDDYSEEIGLEICGRIAMGHSLAKICSDKNMPSTVTVYAWFKKYPELLNDYARAKEDGGHADADKVEDIAEKVLTGVYDPQAARVAIDAFKWTAGKKLPKKYGDRQHIEHTGKVGLIDLTDAELKKKLEDLENEEE